MFKKRDYEKISYKSIGLVFILFGAIVFSFALASWLLQFYGYTGNLCAFPFFKAIGAAVIIGLGYLILEMELLIKK